MKTNYAIACMAMVCTGTAAWSADTAQGQAKSVVCQACHGVDGIGIGDDVPNLAGQKAGYVKQQLAAFKSETRKHDVMNPIAKQLAQADIDNLAAYWQSLAPGAATASTPPSVTAARSTQMEFPKDFPNGFAVYYTDENTANKSIDNYYANSAAIQAARAGKPLPNGSVIMVAGFNVKLDANQQPIKDASGHLIADKPTYYSGMEVRDGWGDAIPELLRNGNWNYALFTPEQKRGRNNYAMCLGCHKAKASDDYLFTLDKLRAKAKAN
jgi:cytochrome c553